jgi:catechol 1,2-dioxygenase
MIIENQADVTKAVLSELARAPDPRFREIMSAFIRHLHDFAREVKLTEQEFQTAAAFVNAIGKSTNENHNEAVLMAGSLGLSALVCLLNNGDNGQTETDASQLGPFWRMNSPLMKSGASIVRSPTPGPALFVDAYYRDVRGKPIEGVEVDVWHSSPEGFYENQDPTRRAILVFARSSRPAIQSRSTVRSVIFCAHRAATTCVRPIFISWLTRMGSRL